MSENRLIVINIATQTLELFTHGSSNFECQYDVLPNSLLLRSFSVSTAKNGIGSQENTGCTPLGRHVVSDKIGEGMPLNTVFVGRVPTGEIYNQDLSEKFPNRDWILTRILWLQGCEEGKNKGSNEQGCCDTHQRYIYIHGTPDSEPMGIPLSHGCIRMRNNDLVWLYDNVTVGTPILIKAY